MKHVLLYSSMVLLTAGCGGGPGDMPELADVSGTVTVGGKPLPNALIEFRPTESGRPSTGRTADDGTYSLQYTVENSGAIIGEHSVFISPIGDEGAYEADGTQIDAEAQDDAASSLPAAASDGSLKKTVKAESNIIDIAL
ncbi:MAG: carboxypeptidase-like regulatory domain-containing protein [Fuerstiella sp.]